MAHVNAAIHQGLHAKNLLAVVAQGTHFTFKINGVQVGATSDSTYGAGLCGVSGNSGGNVEVVFTNFLVTVPN